MDLLFSYKGGDEFMNNVLLYFALKHDGDFEKIYNDIKASPTTKSLASLILPS